MFCVLGAKASCLSICEYYIWKQPHSIFCNQVISYHIFNSSFLKQTNYPINKFPSVAFLSRRLPVILISKDVIMAPHSPDDISTTFKGIRSYLLVGLFLRLQWRLPWGKTHACRWFLLLVTILLTLLVYKLSQRMNFLAFHHDFHEYLRFYIMFFLVILVVCRSVNTLLGSYFLKWSLFSSYWSWFVCLSFYLQTFTRSASGSQN